MSNDLKLPGINWADIDIEQFRGESLAFPVEMSIIVSPAYGLFVLGSVNNFIDYYRWSVLDPEGTGFETELKFQIATDQEVVDIQPTEICLHMTYIDGDTSVVIIDPMPAIH